MKNKFVFTGDWITKIKLSHFDLISKNGSLFELQIFDELNDNPDPETYQINTINYLLECDKQLLILNSLKYYTENVIYPHYKTFLLLEEHPECYPKIDSIEDLNKIYDVIRIIIKTISKNNYAYYILECNSCLDTEHGINITLHKNRIIDHSEEWDDIKVCDDLGIDYDEYHTGKIKDFNEFDLKTYNPHPKYQKLKPWQHNRNKRYPYRLLENNSDDKLIEYLKSETHISKNTITNILSLAIESGKEDIIKFIMNEKSYDLHKAFISALQVNRFDLTNEILNINYDINKNKGPRSPIFPLIRKMVKELRGDIQTQNDATFDCTEKIKYLISKGLNPKLKDNFGKDALCELNRENIVIQNKILELMYIDRKSFITWIKKKLNISKS